MSDSKNGSKTNLNESNMPLLDEDQNEKTGETPEKEQIELTEKEKDDSNEKEKKDKKKKEKKPKKEKGPPGPNCIDTLSAGLNLDNRDQNAINEVINVDFDDVLAEPASTHGVDCGWRLAFILFSQTKLWVYRIVTAVLALPLALILGFLFSLISIFYIWIVTPALKIFDLFVAVFRRIMVGLMRATVEPVCSAFGSVFVHFNQANNRRNIVEEA